MRAAVISFPGSNCDKDVSRSLVGSGAKVEMIWHAHNILPANLDLVVLPGGFSYGDYLRCGAMASCSTIMKDVIAFAKTGGYVLGICNGFQILCETELLPGTLLRNKKQKFICRDLFVKAVNKDSVFTRFYQDKSTYCLPVAHGEGNYYTDEDTLHRLQDEDKIAFCYSDEKGLVINDEKINPNGSMNNIAGILGGKQKNILGIMPHPERVADRDISSNVDGKIMLDGLVSLLN